MAGIEVRVFGRGAVREGVAKVDAGQAAKCDLCGAGVDAVASVGAAFACKGCLRERLEAMTLATWMLREGSSGIPWGKVSG